MTKYGHVMTTREREAPPTIERAAAPRPWNGPVGVPQEMTEADFQEVVEVFLILQRWRDEADDSKNR